MNAHTLSFNGERGENPVPRFFFKREVHLHRRQKDQDSKSAEKNLAETRTLHKLHDMWCKTWHDNYYFWFACWSMHKEAVLPVLHFVLAFRKDASIWTVSRSFVRRLVRLRKFYHGKFFVYGASPLPHIIVVSSNFSSQMQNCSDRLSPLTFTAISLHFNRLWCRGKLLWYNHRK